MTPDGGSWQFDAMWRADLGQLGVHARVPMTAGQVVTQFQAAAHLAEPSRATLQVGEADHVLLLPEALRLLNHSCDPNVFFDVARGELVALRAIAAGEELTFFYPATEWHMAEPFPCHCGARACLARIAGADALPLAVLRRYRLAPHIEAQFSRPPAARP